MIFIAGNYSWDSTTNLRVILNLHPDVGCGKNLHLLFDDMFSFQSEQKAFVARAG